MILFVLPGLSPGRQKSSQRSSVHSNRSSIPSQSQHLHGYQHSPRYQTSEASYNSSHSGHVTGHVTNNPNNMDYMSHQCTPEKPKRDSQTPCSIDASNGAHGHNGYRDNVSNHGYERPMHNTDPPPYHQANKHGDKNSYHSNSHNQQNGAWTSHRNSSHGHPSLRPPPSRPLKAVNVWSCMTTNNRSRCVNVSECIKYELFRQSSCLLWRGI